jgi:hypothetical protein
VLDGPLEKGGRLKALICMVMAFLMTGVPNVVLAETSMKMISTAAVVEELSRAETQAKIETILGDAEVKSRLSKLGLSENEISLRLATLSDAELRQMAAQLDEARFGGEPVTGILVIVVLVLLIIFLARRV